MINKFVEFCKNNFDLNSQRYADYYNSLSICVLDCIYSLRSKYFSVTVPVVNKYANKFLKGDRFADYETLSMFKNNIELSGGCELFAINVLNNRQVLNGRLKSEICYELASKLIKLGIETIDDFRKFDADYLEYIILSIKGIGKAGLNYLFMLAGDKDRCKPDVHIHKCIKDGCGQDVSDDMCQHIFTETVKILRYDYPKLTVSMLDSIVWKKYQSKLN